MTKITNFWEKVDSMHLSTEEIKEVVELGVIAIKEIDSDIASLAEQKKRLTGLQATLVKLHLAMANREVEASK